MRTLLESRGDFAVIGETSDGTEALGLVAKLRPDLLLLDVRMPGLSGPDVVRASQRSSPSTRVVVLTGYADEYDALTFLGAGAHGYLSKTTRAEDLVSALHAVHGGHERVEPEIASRLAARLGRHDGREPTPRELQVLRLVAEGLHNADIADRLSTTPRTVHFHLANVFVRLGVRSRTEAIRRARERGWIP